jgi:hypothetical protein
MDPLAGTPRKVDGGGSGTSCPLVYRYQPEALAQPAELKADTLYVVGGLYGNPAALRALLERTDREPGGAPAIVFNGDSSRGLAAAWKRTLARSARSATRSGPSTTGRARSMLCRRRAGTTGTANCSALDRGGGSGGAG